MNGPVSVSLWLYRRLARAFRHEFRNAYGEELLQMGEEAMEPTWHSLGLWGLLEHRSGGGAAAGIDLS